MYRPLGAAGAIMEAHLRASISQVLGSVASFENSLLASAEAQAPGIPFQWDTYTAGSCYGTDQYDKIGEDVAAAQRALTVALLTYDSGDLFFIPAPRYPGVVYKHGEGVWQTGAFGPFLAEAKARATRALAALDEPARHALKRRNLFPMTPASAGMLAEYRHPRPLQKGEHARRALIEKSVPAFWEHLHAAKRGLPPIYA